MYIPIVYGFLPEINVFVFVFVFVSAVEMSRKITGKFTVNYIEISLCGNIPPGESLQS